MYYTTGSSYKKIKMLIDYTNIFLTGCICVLFVLIMFFRSDSGIMFPLIFLAGTIMNTISGIKKILDKHTVSAIFMFAAAVVLFIMTIMCFMLVF